MLNVVAIMGRLAGVIPELRHDHYWARMSLQLPHCL